jgi:hypothetical protein
VHTLCELKYHMCEKHYKIFSLWQVVTVTPPKRDTFIFHVAKHQRLSFLCSPRYKVFEYEIFACLWDK